MCEGGNTDAHQISSDPLISSTISAALMPLRVEVSFISSSEFSQNLSQTMAESMVNKHTPDALSTSSAEQRHHVTVYITGRLGQHEHIC